MENHSPSVNLLKTKDSFGDKFFAWALTIGRMVIILTETVALVAFLYRFILDRQIIDQRDSINQKAAQIKLYENSEKNFRNLQERLKVITTLQNSATDTVTIFTDVLKMAPAGVTLKSVTINSNKLHIDADVRSVGALTQFVNKLKSNPIISSVSLDKIENKTLNATIVVGITTTLQIKNQPILSP